MRRLSEAKTFPPMTVDSRKTSYVLLACTLGTSVEDAPDGGWLLEADLQPRTTAESITSAARVNVGLLFMNGAQR